MSFFASDCHEEESKLYAGVINGLSRACAVMSMAYFYHQSMNLVHCWVKDYSLYYRDLTENSFIASLLHCKPCCGALHKNIGPPVN